MHAYGEHYTATPVCNRCPWDGADAPEWFHGGTSRKAAETLLLCKPPGYFLVRLSQSRQGYTLSYRATDRCRHFMIDALQNGNYIIVGEPTIHRSLQDLVDFHSRTPLLPFNEVLTVPCGQISEDTETDKDVPPALPHRPSLPPIPSYSTLPYSTPNGFNGQLQDQVLYFDSRMVNAVNPAALPSHAQIYNNNTEAHQAPDPRLLETNSNFLYPTLHSTPSTSGMTVFTTEQSARQDDRADTKPSVTPNQMKLMALFRKKWGASQESPPSADSSAQPGDDLLPQEYLHPPPYAPGYC